MNYKRLDKLGRLYIPTGYRNAYMSFENSAMEITIEYGKIILKPFDWEHINERPCIGVVRFIDNIGRICIPREFFRVLDYLKKSNYTIEHENEKIIIHEV